jgi:hypothetical protein
MGKELALQDRQALNWLLDAETASIRYLVLRTLMDESEAGIKMAAVWTEMKRSGPIPEILDGQTESGSWSGERSYYTPKYTSTHWRMTLLAELHADPDDPRLQAGAGYMLQATEEEASEHLAREKHGLECFWGNLLRYTMYAGLGKDGRRVRNLISILAENAPTAGWRCVHNGENPCAWGAARALWGLCALPESLRTDQVDYAIQRGLSFLLDEYNLVRANYPIWERGKVHPMWNRLNFPLFYQVDILFVLRVLAELEALDHPGAQNALEWLRSRRQVNGHWRGSSPYRSRTFKSLASRSETDRWVSLYAMMILENCKP